MSATEFESVVAEGHRVEGNFVGEGRLLVLGELNGQISAHDLRIVGRVHGHVSLEGSLTIEASGLLEAETEAQHVLVRGRCIGNIRAHSVTLEPGARVRGDIQAATLAIAEGAHVLGAVEVGEGEAQHTEVPNPPSTPPPPRERQMLRLRR